MLGLTLRGEAAALLGAADFRVDDDASGIGALLDSVSNEHHRSLRTKAQQNIISVTEAVANHSTLAPHLQEIVGALWLRSIAVGNLAGGHGRIKVHSATDAVGWRCAAPHGESQLDFGRILWGEAREYPQEILLREGGKPAGLFHLRIT